MKIIEKKGEKPILERFIPGIKDKKKEIWSEENIKLF